MYFDLFLCFQGLSRTIVTLNSQISSSVRWIGSKVLQDASSIGYYVLLCTIISYYLLIYCFLICFLLFPLRSQPHNLPHCEDQAAAICNSGVKAEPQQQQKGGEDIFFPFK